MEDDLMEIDGDSRDLMRHEIEEAIEDEEMYEGSSDGQDAEDYNDESDEDTSLNSGLGLGGHYNVRVTDITLSDDESSFMPEKDWRS